MSLKGDRGRRGDGEEEQAGVSWKWAWRGSAYLGVSAVAPAERRPGVRPPAMRVPQREMATGGVSTVDC